MRPNRVHPDHYGVPIDRPLPATAGRSGAENVMHFEWFVDLDEPLGTLRRPWPAARVERAALAARVPYQLRVVAFACHGIGGGIDGPQHVEIEETVIDWRHQRVGHRMCQPHQVAVVAGGIDHDEIESTLNRADGIHEL